MNVNSLPRVLYLKTCENPNNNILQSEYLDKHDKYFSSAGSLIGVLPRPNTLWVCKSKTGALVVGVLGSPEVRLLCPWLIVSMLCWEYGDTKIMNMICLCKSAV